MRLDDDLTQTEGRYQFQEHIDSAMQAIRTKIVLVQGGEKESV